MEEIQLSADRKDMKKFHDAAKTIFGAKSSKATTLFHADGNTFLADKAGIVDIKGENTSSALNQASITMLSTHFYR